MRGWIPLYSPGFHKGSAYIHVRLQTIRARKTWQGDYEMATGAVDDVPRFGELLYGTAL